MSKREDAWKRYQYDMEQSGMANDEHDGRTAFMTGWVNARQEPTKTDEQITKLASEVEKLAKIMRESRITITGQDKPLHTQHGGMTITPVEDKDMIIGKLERALQYVIDNQAITFNYDTWVDLCRQGGMDV
jgi:hypothetical protein